MKLKGKKLVILGLLLLAIVLVLGMVGSCTSGIMAVGWSGSVVGGDYLFVGANTGRLVSINLIDSSVLRAEPITAPSSGGLLSCACGGGASAVPIYGTPLVKGNSVYIAGYNGRVYSYRADNLAQRWIFPANSYLQAFVGGIVENDGVLYVGCSNEYVYAIDAETGTKIAEFKADSKLWCTPAVDPVSNTLFIGSYDNTFYALDLDTLTRKWSYATGGTIVATPLVDNGVVYIGSFDRYLYAFNIADGNLKWQFRGENWFWAQPLIDNGKLYVPCMDNLVYVLDPVNGTAVHDPYNLNAGIASSPIVVDDFIVFINKNGVLYKLDTGSMALSQIVDLKIDIQGQIMAHEGVIYIHPQENTLKRINVLDGSELPTLAL